MTSDCIRVFYYQKHLKLKNDVSTFLLNDLRLQICRHVTLEVFMSVLSIMQWSYLHRPMNISSTVKGCLVSFHMLYILNSGSGPL